MGHTRNAIARLVVLCDSGPKGDDCASEVASDSGSLRREDLVVDMLPGDL